MLTRLKAVMRRQVRALRRGRIMRAEFAEDFRRYRATCAPSDDAATVALTGTNLEAQLTKDYHRVEKGLSLRAPKQPFGADVGTRLSMLLPLAESGVDRRDYVGFAQDAHTALRSWNSGGIVSDTVSPVATAPRALGEAELREFISSRHSIRHFDESRRVDNAVIEDAVRLAGFTPSVCNRQASRVHSFVGHERCAPVLAHQNGNRGFRDEVQNVLIVTVERGLFAGTAERNQRWIDGGLFAMTLVWAFHGKGVASCMLNWSMTNAQSDALRAEAGIAGTEDIICLIAIGYLPEGPMRVARSPRRPVDEVLTVND